MSAPAGTVANRWGQVVRGVAAEMNWTDEQSDAWLNLVWSGMWQGDEISGNPAARDRLRKFLEVNLPTAPTLPRAFQAVVT